MSELTKEYFDQQLGQLVTKKDFEVVLDDRFEKQAVLINNAFQEQKDYMDNKFNGIDLQFDHIEERLGVVETKLDRALYTETVHLEARVKRLEEKIGIKPQTA